MKIKEFTIDRSKWYRGKGPRASRLLNQEGQMCCLGFFAKACSIADVDILNRSTPADVPNNKNQDWENTLIYGHRDGESGMNFTATRLMIINDYPHHTDQTREEKIINEFAYHGIIVKFVG
jgi:hypothetical protein